MASKSRWRSCDDAVYFEPASMGQPGPVQMRILWAGDLASLSAMANRVVREDWKRSTSPRLKGAGADCANGGVELGRQVIAVGRRIGQYSQAVSGKDRDRCWVGEMAAVLLKVFDDLLLGDCGLFEGRVDEVEEQDEFELSGRSWRPAVDSLKGEDGLRLLLVEDGEVLLLQAGDGRARFDVDHNIELNLANCAARSRRGARLECGFFGAGLGLRGVGWVAGCCARAKTDRTEERCTLGMTDSCDGLVDDANWPGCLAATGLPRVVS